MSAEEIDAFFTIIGDNVATVTLTGGEPGLRSDLGDIIANIRRRTQAFIKVDTSGYNLNSSLEALCEADSIQVSMDGPEPVHDDMRGNGSYACAVKAIEMLRSRGKDVVVNAVICRKTIPYQDDVLDYARSVGARYACNMMMQNRMTRHCPELGINQTEYVEYLEGLDKKRDRYRVAIPSSAIKYYCDWHRNSEIRTSRPCIANNNLIFVECSGRLHRCPYVIDADNPPLVQKDPIAGIASLSNACCSTCVPNLIAFGQLCRLEVDSVKEQIEDGDTLIRPFQLEFFNCGDEDKQG
jgi:MoaA/NifB/PqqE/SkfB family radical SAM enzyme